MLEKTDRNIKRITTKKMLIKQDHRINWLKTCVLLLGVAMTLTACQKESDLLTGDEDSHLQEPNKGRQAHLSARDMPTILDFVNEETNYTRQVLIDKSEIKKAKQDYRNSGLQARMESGFGYIDTSNALAVESEGVTSYTFKVVTKDLTNFINYIVVEDKASQEKYSYFMKYTPTADWVDNRLPLSLFSGTIDYYNENEVLQTTLTLTDGIIINFGNTEIPCPEILFNTVSDTTSSSSSGTTGSTTGGSTSGPIDNGEGTSYDYNPWQSWWTGWVTIGGGGDETSNEQEIDDSDSAGVGQCCETCEAAPGVACTHDHHYYNYRTAQINLKSEPTMENPCVHTGVIAFLVGQLEFTQEQLNWLMDMEQEAIYVSLIDYLNTGHYSPLVIDIAQEALEILMDMDCDTTPSQEVCACLELGMGMFECVVEGGEEDCSISDDDLNYYYSTLSPFNVDLSEVRPSCDNIDTTSVAENQKFMCIYNKLTQSPKFKDLFTDVFGETKEINAKFEILDLGDTTGGNCGLNSHTMNPDGSIASANVIIKLNKRMFELGDGNYNHGYNRSAILIAKTIIHECLHAYIHIKKLECEANIIDWELFDNITFPELLNEYYDGSCEPLQEQHQFIFNYLMPVMTEILGDVKDDLIPISNQDYVSDLDLHNIPGNPFTESHLFNWDEFFYYMSLVGLHNSEAFESEIENSTIENFLYDKYRAYARDFSKNCEQ